MDLGDGGRSDEGSAVGGGGDALVGIGGFSERDCFRLP